MVTSSLQKKRLTLIASPIRPISLILVVWEGFVDPGVGKMGRDFPGKRVPNALQEGDIFVLCKLGVGHPVAASIQNGFASEIGRRNQPCVTCHEVFMTDWKMSGFSLKMHIAEKQKKSRESRRAPPALLPGALTGRRSRGERPP